MADFKVFLDNNPRLKARVEEMERQLQTGTLPPQLQPVFAEAERIVQSYQTKHGKLPTDKTDTNDFVQLVVQEKENQQENQKNPIGRPMPSQNEGTSSDDGRQLHSHTGPVQGVGPSEQSPTSQVEEED